jgi:NAD(P)-dependent dehydrogenase (short-subunit alcohol dehydrogenase family)
MTRKVAFITGASRGIGKACAVELADAGFDVAITARTVNEGDALEHSPTVAKSDISPLPGSLASTIALVQQTGAKGMMVAADLQDPASLGVAVTQVLERWGRIDVVVHNGRYIGPGHMDRFLDTPIELLRKTMEANVFAPLVIDQLVLPQMIANGGGIIVNMTSAVAYADPRVPAGTGGGWGMGYSLSKGAFQRVAGFLKVELADKGIRCFNVSPGFVATERMAQDMGKFGFGSQGAPAQVPAKVVRWLCTSPEADAYNAVNIEAQHFCHERGLLPGWPGPVPAKKEGVIYDLSGYNLDQITKAEIAAQAEPAKA